MVSSLLLYPLLVGHIVAGTVAIVSGTTAMASRKGKSTLHARSGRWFVVSMLFMTTSAAALTWWEPDPLSLLTAILTLYLVATSWMAAQGRGWRRYEWTATLVGLCCAIALAVIGTMTMQSPDGAVGGFSHGPFFVFGSVALLAVLLDLNFQLRAGVSQRHRMARHLWRMCAAFFLAATSLFLGQQDDVFFFMDGSPLLFIPSLATVIFMAFWLVRVHFAKQWLRPARSRSLKATPSLPRK